MTRGAQPGARCVRYAFVHGMKIHLKTLKCGYFRFPYKVKLAENVQVLPEVTPYSTKEASQLSRFLIKIKQL